MVSLIRGLGFPTQEPKGQSSGKLGWKARPSCPKSRGRPTLVTTNGSSIVDIWFRCPSLSRRVQDWRVVAAEETGSDYQYIGLEISVPMGYAPAILAPPELHLSALIGSSFWKPPLYRPGPLTWTGLFMWMPRNNGPGRQWPAYAMPRVQHNTARRRLYLRSRSTGGRPYRMISGRCAHGLHHS